MFLKMFCAVLICPTKKYAPYLPLARTLFIEYIEVYIATHGVGSITSNIHNLSYVVDDVELFGELSTFSAYEFENCLHLMKLLLKQCNKPLEQLARRLHEIALTTRPTSSENNSVVSFPRLIDQFLCNSAPNSLAYRKVEINSNILISSDNKNRWIMLGDENQTIVQFEYAFKIENKYMFRGHPLNLDSREKIFTRPFNSCYVNIFLQSTVVDDAENYDFSQVKAKLFCLPYRNKFVFMPLLHTL